VFGVGGDWLPDELSPGVSLARVPVREDPPKHIIGGS
jgi:hypothetical protein